MRPSSRAVLVVYKLNLEFYTGEVTGSSSEWKMKTCPRCGTGLTPGYVEREVLLDGIVGTVHECCGLCDGHGAVTEYYAAMFAGWAPESVRMASFPSETGPKERSCGPPFV